MDKAVVRATMAAAAKGGIHAQRLATKLIRNAEAANRADHEYWVQVLRNYKDYWDAEPERRKNAGITDLPGPIPHPDHIDFDLEEGTVVISGPKDQHEKDELDALIAAKEENHKQLAAKIKEIKNAKTKDAKRKAIVELEERAKIRRLSQYYDPDPEDGSQKAWRIRTPSVRTYQTLGALRMPASPTECIGCQALSAKSQLLRFM